MNPVLVVLIAQAIELVLAAVTKGKVKDLDVAPALIALNNALGHATEESDGERASRQAAAEAVFAKHSSPLA
jgi:hypothetical protein